MALKAEVSVLLNSNGLSDIVPSVSILAIIASIFVSILDMMEMTAYILTVPKASFKKSMLITQATCAPIAVPTLIRQMKPGHKSESVLNLSGLLIKNESIDLAFVTEGYI